MKLFLRREMLFIFFCLSFILVSCQEERKPKEYNSMSHENIILEKATHLLKAPKDQLFFDKIDKRFFKKFTFFRVYSSDFPSKSVVLAISEDKRLFSLFPKNEFNKIVKEEGIMVETQDRALEYAQFYLRLIKRYGYEVLNDIRDVDGTREDQIRKYAGKVKPPSVDFNSTGYAVEFFTWGLGEIEKHSFQINKLGKVSHHSITMAKKIGNFITLE